MHPRRDAALGVLGDADQFDDVSEVRGERHVDRGEFFDAFVIDVVEPDPGAEREGSEDGGLRSGVRSGDVGGGVRFGVTEFLRFGESVAVVRPVVGHAAEDEVGRAVDDAEYPVDGFAGQRLRQRPDDRNAAADGRFEEQWDAAAFGRCDQLGPPGGDELARFECCEDQIARQVPAPHQFDDELDVGIGDDAHQVVGDDAVLEVERPRLAQVSHGNPQDPQIETGFRSDCRPVVHETGDERAPDGPRSEDPDAYR